MMSNAERYAQKARQDPSLSILDIIDATLEANECEQASMLRLVDMEDEDPTAGFLYEVGREKSDRWYTRNTEETN